MFPHKTIKLVRVAVLLLLLPATVAVGAEGDLPLPWQENHPGLGWYISPGAMEAILVQPSKRYATASSCMKIDFTTRKGSKEGFVLYPVTANVGKELRLAEFGGIGFYYCGNGSKALLRMGLLIAPREEFGEKVPQRFTLDLQLDKEEWRKMSLGWNDFPHALDRPRLLDGRDQLLAITFNLAPPPQVPTECWIDGVTLLKKLHELPKAQKEPGVVAAARPFMAAQYSEAYGVLSRTRRKLEAKEPVNLLVLSGAETFGFELWNLPGKPADYVFTNVLMRELELHYEQQEIALHVLGGPAETINSDAEALFSKLRRRVRRADLPPLERVEKLLNGIEVPTNWPIEELYETGFDAVIVFFSYNDVRLDPDSYVNSLDQIMKTARREPVIEMLVVSPLPAADLPEQSTKLATAVKNFCRENRIPYADVHSGFLINGWSHLRNMMIDPRRMNWHGHEAVGRVIYELLRRQRTEGEQT